MAKQRKSRELSPEMQQPSARRFSNDSVEGMGSTSIPRSGSTKPPLPGKNGSDYIMPVGDRRRGGGQ